MTQAEIIDAVVKIVALVGAAAAFLWGLHQWKEGQRWKRAERLDTLIREFATTPLVSLACKVIDWNASSVTLAPDDVVVYDTSEVRDALQVHWDASQEAVEYPPPRNRIRDALDALLDFFVRLEHEIAADLVEARPAIQHFGYWICRLETMSEHARDKTADLAKVRKEMRRYEQAYSDPAAMRRLFRMTVTQTNIFDELRVYTLADGQVSG
jgi:hypothetical protein